MIPAVTCLVFLGGAPFSHGQALEGFPSQDFYSSDALEGLQWMEYEKASEERSAPIAKQVLVDGVRERNPAEFFNERLLFSLPKGQAIQVSANEEVTKWDFPVGTRFAHEIRFKDRDQTYFEFRMMERLKDQKWGFGVYRKSAEGFVLNKNSQSEELIFELHLDKSSQSEPPLSPASQVKLQNIPQKVCAMCHQRASLGAIDGSGPCDFHPLNPNLGETWAKSFSDQNGWWPFTDKALSPQQQVQK